MYLHAQVVEKVHKRLHGCSTQGIATLNIPLDGLESFVVLCVLFAHPSPSSVSFKMLFLLSSSARVLTNTLSQDG
jgi:hypothetical protein